MRNLGLEITPDPTMCVLREATAADCEDTRGGGPQRWKKMRFRHHSMAKALVQGYEARVVAAMWGVRPATLSALQQDPSFKMLLKHYEAKAAEAFVTFTDKMADLAEGAVEELSERLEDDPEKLTNGELLKIVTVTADRTGHGPSSAIVHSVADGFAERLAEGRKRAADRRRLLDSGEIIDVSPERVKG